MKKLLWIGLAFLVVLVGCNLSGREFYRDEGELLDPTKGSVTLVLNGEALPTKTIAPPTSMDVHHYIATFYLDDVFAFEETINASQVTLGVLEKTGLEPADTWSVAVNAYNISSVLIGAINGTVHNPPTTSSVVSFEINPGVSTPVIVDVIPFTGDGDLRIFVSWPDSIDEGEEVTAKLDGATITWTTSIFNDPMNEREYLAGTIEEGYYILSMQLGGGGEGLLWGWAEAVRILAGATTDTGTQFVLSTMGSGVNLSPFMQVEITFDSPAPTWADGSTPIADMNNVDPGNGLIVTAATDPADPGTGQPDAYTYAWYLDGSPESDGDADSVFSFTVDDALLTAGAHNLSVLVTTNGGSISSNTIGFVVIP